MTNLEFNDGLKRLSINGDENRIITINPTDIAVVSRYNEVLPKLDELTERNEKLGNLLGKIKSENWEAHQKLLNSLNGEQKKLLAKQYMIQKKLMHILKRRLEIWTEE